MPVLIFVPAFKVTVPEEAETIAGLEEEEEEEVFCFVLKLDNTILPTPLMTAPEFILLRVPF